LVWPDLALIRIEISLKTKKSTSFFTCTAGHFEQLICPRRGAFPGLCPGVGLGGGVWALLEMTDA